MVAKEKENNIAAEEEKISEEQLKLILQLYKEYPAFPNRYEQKDLIQLSQKAGNTHIQVILEWKKNQNGGTKTQTKTQFQDVSYGMVWKTLENFWLDKPEARPTTEEGMALALHYKYLQYLKCRNFTEKEFQKGAVQ